MSSGSARFPGRADCEYAERGRDSCRNQERHPPGIVDADESGYCRGQEKTMPGRISASVIPRRASVTETGSRLRAP